MGGGCKAFSHWIPGWAALGLCLKPPWIFFSKPQRIVLDVCTNGVYSCSGMYMRVMGCWRMPHKCVCVYMVCVCVCVCGVCMCMCVVCVCGVCMCVCGVCMCVVCMCVVCVWYVCVCSVCVCVCVVCVFVWCVCVCMYGMCVYSVCVCMRAHRTALIVSGSCYEAQVIVWELQLCRTQYWIVQLVPSVALVVFNWWLVCGLIIVTGSMSTLEWWCSSLSGPLPFVVGDLLPSDGSQLPRDSGMWPFN